MCQVLAGRNQNVAHWVWQSKIRVSCWATNNGTKVYSSLGPNKGPLLRSQSKVILKMIPPEGQLRGAMQSNEECPGAESVRRGQAEETLHIQGRHRDHASGKSKNL